MNLGLNGRVAAVVGGASGIGRAIAEEFAAEGCHVALFDRAATVQEVADQINGQYTVSTLGLVVDVTDYAVMQQAVTQLTGTLGSVDHLVYAAGMASGKGGFPFWNLEPSDWPRVLDVNLVGAVNTLHAFVPNFTAQRSGTILLLSSVAGQTGSQTDPPYSAAKAGLINFGQCAARDFAEYNVRVNTLCPGMVDTPLNRKVWEGQMAALPADHRVDFDTWGKAKIKNRVPLNRWQQPQDIAHMAVFLASPMAENVTGQTINVDGGFVMHW